MGFALAMLAIVNSYIVRYFVRTNNLSNMFIDLKVGQYCVNG